MRLRRWVTAVVPLLPAVARADTWPDPLPAGWDRRGPGGGLALVPLACWWACVLGWAATVDWVARDARKHKFRPALWSSVVAGPFVVAALAAWWIPSVIGGLAVMILAWLAPVVAYAIARNKQVAESERILTAGHARRAVAGLLQPLGIDLGVPVDEAELLPTA